MIDHQLAATLEEVAECLPPVLALEGVGLFDELPGQIAPLPAQLVTHPGELLLLRQVLLPCLEPLIVFHHLVRCHGIPPSSSLDVRSSGVRAAPECSCVVAGRPYYPPTACTDLRETLEEQRKFLRRSALSVPLLYPQPDVVNRHT